MIATHFGTCLSAQFLVTSTFLTELMKMAKSASMCHALLEPGEAHLVALVEVAERELGLVADKLG